jgi:hypothetical protein
MSEGEGKWVDLPQVIAGGPGLDSSGLNKADSVQETYVMLPKQLRYAISPKKWYLVSGAFGKWWGGKNI